MGKLTEIRESKGMSKVELARRSNVSRATINRIESGKVCPHISTITMLANILDVTPAELLNGNYAQK